VIANHDETHEAYFVLSPRIIQNLIEGMLPCRLPEVAYDRKVRKGGRFICLCGLTLADMSGVGTEIKFDSRSRDGRRRHMKWIAICGRGCFARTSDVRDERVLESISIDSKTSTS
jgi:hypothetical protein